MGTSKTIVTSNWDVSNVQVIIWQTSVTTTKDLVMFDVSYVVETTLQITRDVQSTKSYKKKAYPPFWLKQYTPAQIKKSYKLNQELHMPK
jgi:hypothetical protein